MRINRDISATINKRSVTFKYDNLIYVISKEKLRDLASQLLEFPKGFSPVPEEIELSKIKPGTWFLGVSHSKPVKGKIQIQDKEVFLCQNEMPGFPCRDKLGYGYSYTLGDSIRTFKDYVYAIALPSKKVENLKIVEAKQFCVLKEKREARANNYPVFICYGSIKIGCQIIPNDVVKKFVLKEFLKGTSAPKAKSVKKALK